MPSISEILEARRAAAADAPVPAQAIPAPGLDDDPHNILINEALRIFSAEIEKDPPEIATPFGPRVNDIEEQL